jgi:Permuted papain-like amidase enzyme, YaeF/YiiX, C92 family
MIDIKAADVIFYRPTGFIGWVISKLTRSEYSHVSIAINSTSILESNRFIKSRVSDLEYVADIHSVYRLPNLTEEERNRIVTYALTMSGVSYDYTQLFGLFLRAVFSIDTTIFNSMNKYICSEVIDLAFMGAGVKRKDDKHIGDITPQELFEKYDLIRVQ